MRLRATLVAATTAVVLTLTACGLPTPSIGGAPAGNGAAPAAGGAAATNGGLAIPGLGSLSGCLGVSLAYASLMLAILPTALTGTSTFNGTSIDSAVAQLRQNIPASLQPDVDVIANAAKAAQGKTLAEAGQILGTPEVNKATDDISNWLDANCGGTSTK